jgi:hypothetical protein
MLDLEDQIARLASMRAEQVEPWRPGAVERGAAVRPHRWWSPRVLLAAVGVSAAAAIVAVTLVPHDDSGTRITTTVAPTLAPTTTAAGPSTPPPGPAEPTITPISGAPGTPFSGTSQMRDHRFLPRESQTVDVWFVRAGSASGVRSASGLAGTATIEPSGSITILGRVPHALASAERDVFPAGTVFAMVPGEYRIAFEPFVLDGGVDLYGLGGLVFQVTEIGSGLGPPDAADHVPAPARAVLGADELASVAFGTSANEAIDRLSARFGRPDSDTGWENACLTERRLTWGGLTAWFSGDGPAGEVTDGVFGWYHYERSEGITAGLETPSGVRLGNTLAELTGREPTTTWLGGYDSQELALWTTDGGLIGSLSQDVTGPGPVVTSIGAGADIGPYTVC